MIAQLSGLRFLFASRYGGRVISQVHYKHYQGYWCLQLAEGADMVISIDGQRSRYQGTVLWVSYPGPEIGF